MVTNGSEPAARERRPASIDWGSKPHGSSQMDRHAGSLLARAGSWERANTALIALFCVVATLFVAGVKAVGELYEAIHEGSGATTVDQSVQAWALAHRSPGLDHAIAFYSNTGGPVLQPIITGIVLTILCLRWRSWTPLVLTLLAEAGAIAMTIAGKHLAGRARPPLDQSVPPYEYSASFPSGHTLNATVIAGILCYLFLHRFHRSAVRAVCVAIAALYAISMGLSRVYLGHHWLTDVLAGWALSLAWLGLVIFTHQLWVTARRRLHPQRWYAIGAPDEHRQPADEGRIHDAKPA